MPPAAIAPAFVMPGLTKAQHAARKKGIGGSDARLIMAGAWRELWEEKTGRRAGEDLSDNLAVQMGNVTEGFNAFWYEKQTGIKVDRSPKIKEVTHHHPSIKWMLCNLDGMVTIDGRKRVWEAKHTNPFGSSDNVRDTNYAQIQHNIEVMGAEGLELSAFYGNINWGRFSIERDPDYIAQLMEREEAFWQHVTSDTPPPAEGVTEIKVDFDKLVIADMRPNNMWGDSEATWLKHKEATASFKSAETALKAMIPADVGFAYGHGTVCVRDRAGKLTLREPNKADTHRLTEILQGEPL